MFRGGGFYVTLAQILTEADIKATLRYQGSSLGETGGREQKDAVGPIRQVPKTFHLCCQGLGVASPGRALLCLPGMDPL